MEGVMIMSERGERKQESGEERRKLKETVIKYERKTARARSNHVPKEELCQVHD